LLILAACGGGGSGENSAGKDYSTTPANTAPVILGGYSNAQIYCCYFDPNNEFFSLEGETSIFTVSASDAEDDLIAFSLSGDDASKITISKKDDSNEAVVSFISATDFDAPEMQTQIMSIPLILLLAMEV
jgi:hypothetical protein